MIRRIFRPERFTGWHMVGVLGLFFGTIIAVNAVLAILASGSWSGLVVKNTYVASQEYNEKLAAADRQAARGWSGSFEYGEAGRIVFTLVDRDGEPVLADTVRVALRRPA
ncbi:MAG: cytochrome oxidase, partial [Gemmatimonadetes bacterium]|nr:cytochrome oxidase [Gemmatimonadota bacterium]NIS01366.1 cytochrome oxidase [Gemmatimonadota bacterium]NIT67106.1 cytochrome oxidase [Gemmatimonadota bacterium]NIV23892.1 cytochrome oxidase [Gemmatimonadota bacterium]NIW75791.1 cytochrome oxidase [Gemmatimonadota bacterium]